MQRSMVGKPAIDGPLIHFDRLKIAGVVAESCVSGKDPGGLFRRLSGRLRNIITGVRKQHEAGAIIELRVTGGPLQMTGK